MNYYKTGKSLNLVMKANKVESINFSLNNIDYTISNKGQYMYHSKHYRTFATNSNGTRFDSYIKAEDSKYYYIVVGKGDFTKTSVAIITTKKSMAVKKVMKWGEMQKQYLSEFFKSTISKADKIKQLQAKQAELQTEIDKLQAEIESLK